MLAICSLARAAAPLTGDPVDCVNPLSGTNGDREFSRGNTLAAIVAPFCMTTWAPQSDGNAGPFYPMKHHSIEGIRATHQPGIWMRDYGDFLIMPVTGEVKGSVHERASTFIHYGETARPYYYSVDLQRYDATFEITPSERCAMMRVSFPNTDSASIVLTAEGGVEAVDGGNKTRIRGKATHVTFGAPRDFGKYFVAEFDHPYQSVDIRRDDKTDTAVVRFGAAKKGDPVTMRIGTSFISYEQAELNLSREMPDHDFEKARSSARGQWSRELAKVDIKGATDEQKSTYYTALYRNLQFPRMFHEPDKDGKMRHYSPFAEGKIFDGPLYTDNGLWDTDRAAFPLLVLFYPEHSSSILEGWLNAYREGGSLPAWPSPGNRPCMIGSHSDSLFADAWVKGLRGFDIQEAYQATLKNAMISNSWAGRDHVEEYIGLGYVPSDKRRDAATSCTLEYAYGDWCVGRIAKAAGKDDIAEKLFVTRKKLPHRLGPEVRLHARQDFRWKLAGTL